MIKNFQHWLNENMEGSEQELADAQNLFDLGIIDRLEFIKAVKKVDPDKWADELFKELVEMHSKNPNSWGMPVRKTSPYNTIEFDLTEVVIMPEEHWTNYEYECLWQEPVRAVIYLDGDTKLELIGSYAREEYDSDEGYGEDEDTIDSTWSYDGEIPIFTLEDIEKILDSYEYQVSDGYYNDEGDWYHD